MNITSVVPDLENGYVYGVIPESSYTPIHLNIVSNDVSYSTEDANENIQYWNGSSWATYPSAGLSSSAGEQFRFSLGGGEVEADITRSTDSVVNDASVGTVSWSGVNNVILNNGVYATAGSGGGPWVSNYIKATNFGFSIPETAIITGIKIDFERYRGGTTGVIADSQIKIVKSDGALGTENKALIYESPDWTIWPTSSSISYQSYGGENDSWGESWTASDINNSMFGVAVSVTKPAGTAHVTMAYIDHIQITVYYTEEGSPPDTGYFSVYAYSK